MNRKTLGLILMGVGAVLIVAGVLSLGGGEEDTEQFAAPVTVASTTTTAPPPTTTTAPPTTTTSPPATTTTTTTTTPPTTTTAATTTTTAPPSIEDFIVAYAAATEGGDSTFLVDRLLPDLQDIFGAELCRTWVDREILAISGYEQTGEVSGPFSRTLNVGETSIVVEQYYEAPVRFTFSGQTFDVVATFVIRNNQVFWIGECR